MNINKLRDEIEGRPGVPYVNWDKLERIMNGKARGVDMSLCDIHMSAVQTALNIRLGMGILVTRVDALNRVIDHAQLKLPKSNITKMMENAREDKKSSIVIDAEIVEEPALEVLQPEQTIGPTDVDMNKKSPWKKVALVSLVTITVAVTVILLGGQE